MKRVYYILAFAVTVFASHAADAAGLISLKALAGWKEVSAVAPGAATPAFPTVRYIPTDQRKAELLVTVFGRGDGRVSDLNALRKLHQQMCRPYLASPQAEFGTQEIKFAHGIGVYASFEDPDLIGKTAKPGDYKVASPVALLLDGGVVGQATILSDEMTGTTFQEALNLLKTVSWRDEAAGAAPASSDESATIVISQPTLDAELVIPNAGLSKIPTSPTTGHSYFSYITKDGLMLSGWLEHASKYKGLRQMWPAEKKEIEAGTGSKFEAESFQLLSGWQVVFYTVQLPGELAQQNVRACRIYGRTWIDVHLSATGPAAERGRLNALLRSLTVRSKNAGSNGSDADNARDDNKI